MKEAIKANARFGVEDIVFEIEFLGGRQCSVSYFSEVLGRWIEWPGLFSTGDNLTNACRAMLPIIKGKTYQLGWVTVQPHNKGSYHEDRSKSNAGGADAANAGTPQDGGDGGTKQAVEGDRRRADADLCVTAGIEAGSEMPEGITTTSQSIGCGHGNDHGGRV